MSIELSVIRSPQAFKECKSKWENFRHQQNDHAMCNSWYWLNTWIDIFLRPQDQLYLHVWRNKDEIVGLIPCYLKSTFAGNELRFIATGEVEKAEVCSEFQDFILDTDFKEEILAQFTDRIMANANISAVIFNNVLITSKVYQWLETLNKHRWIKTVKSKGKRYLIPVKQEQTAQLSSFKSKSIKRHAKQFFADSHWHVVLINDSAALTKFYPQLIKEHNSAWRKRGKIGAFEQTDFVAFHRLFSHEMLANNKLVAFKLEHEDEVSALFYGIIDGDTLYYYQSAVNHESKLSSAGVAMHVIALNIARENNLAFYDLMKGSNDSYKTRYIQSDIQVVNCSLFNKRYYMLKVICSYYKKVVLRILTCLKLSNHSKK